MSKLKKLFGGINLTWPKLIIFSIIVAVYTALMMLIPFTKTTALCEIGIGFEMWFILAIFVISNCHSIKEAGLKTFIFFLISQPLIYLIQQPFNSINLIQTYYLRWFIITLLTFPGAMIAYLIKKDTFYSALILDVAGVFLCIMGIIFMFNGKGISYIIYGLFLIVVAILFTFVIFENKKTKLIYIIIVVLSIVIFGTYTLINKNAAGTYEYQLDNKDWYVSYATYDGVMSDVKDDKLIITYSKANCQASLVLENSNGERKEFEVIVKQGKCALNEIK